MAYRCKKSFKLARMNLFGEPIEGETFSVSEGEVFELNDPAIFGADHRLINERGFIEICDERFRGFFEPVNEQREEQHG